jgi:hypothetical protein
MPQAPQVVQLPYNWSTPRNGQKILAIIAHGTVGTDSRAYLSRGGDLPDGSDRRVSIHALIQKPGNPIYRYVPDSKGANHAGFGTMPAPWRDIPVNKCTLGFELENLQNGKDPYPDTQLLAMGWQINEWRRLHGHLPIHRHEDIDPNRRRDTVNLSVAEIERWCVSAAAHFSAVPQPPPPMPDPLRAELLPGPNGTTIHCSKASAAFYTLRGGFGEYGYPLKDEFQSTDLGNTVCSILPCERVTIKRPYTSAPVHLALQAEAKARNWI